MSKNKRTKRLAKYVVQVADAMGMTGWDLHIREAELDSQRANIALLYQQREAWIQFDKDWTTWEPDRLRTTVVHELVHCYTNTAFIPADQITSLLGKDAEALFMASVKDWLEEATDGLARVIAPHMPLIQ